MDNLVPIGKEKLTPAQYSELADVPPELEWLANITNKKTQRAYKIDVQEFVVFTGLHEPAGLRGRTELCHPGYETVCGGYRFLTRGWRALDEDFRERGNTFFTIPLYHSLSPCDEEW